MKINRRLNLVVPIEGDGGTIYVHATPIGREVFEAYHLVIAKTFSRIYNQGLGVIAGPRVAAMVLKNTAVEMELWEGDDGVERGLINEIRRLSNVVMPGPSGWTTIPLQEAVDRKLIDEQDVSEVENALVFFTVASSMHNRKSLTQALDGIASLWGAQTESLNSTEFAASLPTSTPTDSSGAKAKPSSIPY